MTKILRFVSLPTLAVVVLSFLFLASATQADPVGDARPKVRLAVNLAPISALPLIADSRGLFAKYGLDVTVLNFTSGRQALETVLGGGAEIATVAESPITAAVFARQSIAILARMEYSELATLVTTDTIRKPADLKGKRIAYAAGTGSEVYTYELLNRLGIKKSDVTLVNLRPQDMIAAAASGSVDAYDIWQPFIANGKRILGAKAHVLGVKHVYTETFNVVTTSGYQGNNPKVGVAFLRALIDAEGWLKAHREDAITLVAEKVGMPRSELSDVWNDYVFDVALDSILLDALKNHGRWRIESGNVAGGATTLPDFRAELVVDPLKQVAPERVRL